LELEAGKSIIPSLSLIFTITFRDFELIIIYSLTDNQSVNKISSQESSVHAKAFIHYLKLIIFTILQQQPFIQNPFRHHNNLLVAKPNTCLF
jgi:hypothetical protein